MYIDKTSYRNAGRVGIPRSELSLCWKKPPPAPPEFRPNRQVGAGPRNAGQRHERAGLRLRLAGSGRGGGAPRDPNGSAGCTAPRGQGGETRRAAARGESVEIGTVTERVLGGATRNPGGSGQRRRRPCPATSGTAPGPGQNWGRTGRNAATAAGNGAECRGQRPPDKGRLSVKAARLAGKAGAQPASRGARGRCRHGSGPNRPPD